MFQGLIAHPKNAIDKDPIEKNGMVLLFILPKSAKLPGITWKTKYYLQVERKVGSVPLEISVVLHSASFSTKFRS